MNRRIVITGLGVVSSIGIGWQEFWNNLLMGKSGISPVSSFDTSKHFTHNGGEVKNFRPEAFITKEKIKSLNRSSQLALAAAKLALQDSNFSEEYLSGKGVGICIGTTMGSVQTVEIINELDIIHQQPAYREELLSQVSTHSTPAIVAQEFKICGSNLMFSTACAAGNYAIGHGSDSIRFGRADIVLAGGSEPFSKVAFTGFNQLSAVAPEKCQPFDKNRKGMMVAEGAGILILESLENALARSAPIYAEILGYGLSCDAQHMTQPSVEGISKCMIKAMRESRIEKDEVDYISAHGTGTSANDKTECAAIKEVFGPLYKKIPISSIKSMLGHTMGAASALEAITCALIVKNDIIPPTINLETLDPECDIDCVANQARKHTVNTALNNSFAFGGNNACLVIKKFVN
ncbi:MAG: beta-ketoacyl-[acyl-carrier-protein] synthase family protein [Nitrospirota bacterium]